MMASLYDMTYESAVTNAKHLIALGQTIVHLHEGEMPWALASDVEESGSFRFSGPCGFYVIAKDAGLTFKWSVDFEHRGANGAGVSLFDRARLRDVAGLMPPKVRAKFALWLSEKVMPDLVKRSNEIREALNKQVDSEDCVRGLIAFCDQSNG
jgi:hypothetical protein